MDPTVTAAQAALDARVVNYYTAIATWGTAQMDPESASITEGIRYITGVTSSALSSAQLLSDTVDGASGGQVERALRGALANPNADLELILEWLPHDLYGTIAAANPSLGAKRVNTGYRSRRLRRTGAHRKFLANPTIDHGLLLDGARCGEIEMHYITLNPSATAEALTLVHQWDSKAYAHPNCPRALVAVALRADEAMIRAQAASNPRHTATDLEAIARDECNGRRGANSAVLGAVAEALDRLEAAADPTRIAASALSHHPIVDCVADALDADGEHADAIRMLLRAGFDGTAGELVDTAASIVTA
jgi:hypothetical protein